MIKIGLAGLGILDICESLLNQPTSVAIFGKFLPFWGDFESKRKFFFAIGEISRLSEFLFMGISALKNCNWQN